MKKCGLLVLIWCFITTTASAEVLKVVQQEHSKANYFSYTAYCSDGSTKGIHQWFADKRFYDDANNLIQYVYDLKEASDVVCDPRNNQGGVK